MSSQNGREGEQGGQGEQGGEEYGAEPTVQFDAFRARRADDRAQQEMEPEYVFPEEYGATGPESVFPPQQPPQHLPMPPYGGYGPDAAGPGGVGGGGGGVGGVAAGEGRPQAPRRRWRSVAVLGGAVIVAAALGIGVWAAFDSGGASPSSGNTSAAGSTATGVAANGSAGASGKHAKSALTFRVTIDSIGAGSFTGTVLANNENITVTLTAGTHFGTKTHPFSRSDLATGETVVVRARRTGTDTVTATVVTADTTAAAQSDGSTSAGAAA